MKAARRARRLRRRMDSALAAAIDQPTCRRDFEKAMQRVDHLRSKVKSAFRTAAEVSTRPRRMDRREFEKAVRSACRLRRRMEPVFNLPAAAQWIESYKSGFWDGALTRWIQESTGNRFNGLWDALNLIAQETLRSHKPLPDELADWVADRLAGGRSNPQPKPTGRPVENRARDFVIIVAIRRIRRGGFSATRSINGIEEACAEGGSACDVLGRVFGIEKYSAVEQVWRRRQEFWDCPTERP